MSVESILEANAAYYNNIATEFLKRTKTKIVISFIKNENYFSARNNHAWNADFFKVVLKRAGKQFTYSFAANKINSTGNGGNPPGLFDILGGLHLYNFGAINYHSQNDWLNPTNKIKQKEYNGILRIWSINELNEFITLTYGKEYIINR